MKTTPIFLRLPPNLAKWLYAEKERTGVPVTIYLRKLIAEAKEKSSR